MGGFVTLVGGSNTAELQARQVFFEDNSEIIFFITEINIHYDPTLEPS